MNTVALCKILKIERMLILVIKKSSKLLKLHEYLFNFQNYMYEKSSFKILTNKEVRMFVKKRRECFKLKVALFYTKTKIADGRFYLILRKS